MFRDKYNLLILALIFSGSAPALADPSSRVGRLSYIDGAVSFRPASQEQWSLATLNYPVVSGDSFWTDANARNEIQIGSIKIRMDQATEIDITQLDDEHTSINVPQGVVNIHMQAAPLGGTMEVMTPAGEVDLVEPGSYHIDSGQPLNGMFSNQVQVTALEGQLQIRSLRSLLEVMPGETAVLAGNPPTYSLHEGNATAFDNWALSREKREMASTSLRYVSSHMTGYEDLDQYGQWYTIPQYGAIWYPASVNPEWAPYRYGHWVFVQPWGWTWVDDAPWGFAPFHYGRWICIQHRWGWVPGQIVERPVYAPALVAFIGGAHWNLSFSSGIHPAVGWVPLAPHEAFYPYYPASANYVRNVNITHVNNTVINNITVNNVQNVTVTNFINHQAATVVPATAFTQATPVHKAAISISTEQLVKAPITPVITHLQPDPAALSGGKPMSLAGQSHLPHHEAASPVEKTVNAPLPVHSMQSQSFGSSQFHELRNESTDQTLSVHTQDKNNPVVPVPHPVSAPNTLIPSPHTLSESHATVPASAVPTTRTQSAPVHGEANEALPKAPIAHPEQKTHMVPTLQGWQRVPMEHHPVPVQGQSVHEERNLPMKNQPEKIRDEKKG